ncbi:putative G-box-binding factor 4-like isoform 2 [Capsicum annuum]|nr:putative G-box-binding factor 4-like isoform 2 [Capsicum annuum]
MATGGGDGDVGPCKTVDEVWRDIIAGLGWEYVRVSMIATTSPPPPPSSTEMVAPDVGGGFVVDNMMGRGNCQFLVARQQNEPGGCGMKPPPPPHMGYGNRVVVAAITGSESGSGSEKRRAAKIERCTYVFTQISGLYCGIGVFGYIIGGGKCKVVDGRGLFKLFQSLIDLV